MDSLGPYRLVPVGPFHAKVSPEDYDRIAAFRWTPHSKGYAQASVKREGKWTTVLMHREIMHPQGRAIVDHDNRDRLDNRRGNLRNTTQSVNIARAHPTGGVYRKGRQWVIQFGNKYMGSHPTKEAAEAARKVLWEDHVRA